MIQRIQTLLWGLAILTLFCYSFQVYDVAYDFRNYQHPPVAIFTGLSIIFLALSIFSFHRRNRQYMFSNISLVLLMIQFGFQIYNHISLGLTGYWKSIVLLIISIILNLLGSIAIRRDIKLLQNSSRLR